MKIKLLSLVSIITFTLSCLQSCEQKKSEKTNLNGKNSEGDRIPISFKSQLRPNENIVVGKTYADTVRYLKFRNNKNAGVLVVKKNKDSVLLIYNQGDPNFSVNDQLEIKWKIYRIKSAENIDLANYREILVSVKNISKSVSVKDFTKAKKQSFVISCGGGCAMTYNVKNIEQINEVSIKVKFQVQMYIDENPTETYEETYIFNYGNINTIINAKTNENIRDNFSENGIQYFEEFGAKLMR